MPGDEGVQFARYAIEMVGHRLPRLIRLMRRKCAIDRLVLDQCLGNLVERRKSLLHLCCRENADRFERSCPRSIHGNFVREETAIKRERALERVKAYPKVRTLGIM